MQITNERLEKAKAEAKALWDEMLALEAKYEPFKAQVEAVRSRWYKADQEREVMERLLKMQSEGKA